MSIKDIDAKDNLLIKWQALCARTQGYERAFSMLQNAIDDVTGDPLFKEIADESEKAFFAEVKDKVKNKEVKA